MADDDINLGIETDLDEADATRQADRLAGIFEDAFSRAAPRIGRDIGQEMARAFRRVNIGDDALNPFIRGAERAVQAGREVSERTERISESFDRLGESGRRATRTINVDELNSDLLALQQRVEASRATLQDLGARPNLFAVIDRELEKVLRTAAEFNNNLEEITRNPNLFEGFQESLRQSRRVISGELDAQTRLLINFKEDQRAAATGIQRDQDRASRERVATIRQASSQFVVAEQGANAQRLAETRIAGQRLVQQERIAARTRIEVVRFTFRQIQILERGIAGAFRATGRVAQAAARTTQAALGRIGGLFRRSNRDLNDGLNSALIARERTLDRSFDRQTVQMRGALAQQSALLNRFERQASTGIAGAVTGRSRLGGLFGAGIGIGGGFLLARQLREGFQESVNLTESLNAVREITGEASAEIESFSENAVEALFLTRSAALEAAVSFASFGKSAGLGGTELAGFSNTLTQLATDLASFRNTSVEEAVTSLSAALAGEVEPIRRNYSVLLNEATLQQRAFTEGITDTVRQLQPQERVLAAYAEILAQTTDAQGDAARTSRDFANASKQLGAGITSLFAALLGKLKPLATTVVNVLNPAVARLTEIIEGDASPALIIFRDALVGASIALAGLLAARIAAEAIQFLGLALRGAVTPLGLLIVGVAAAGAAIRIFSQRSERFAAIVDGVSGALRDLAGRGLRLAGRGLGLLVELITSQVIPAVLAFVDIIDGPLIRGLEIAIGFIITIAIPAFTRLATLLANNIVPALQAVGSFLVGTVVPALRDFGSAAVVVLGAVVRFLDPAISGFIQLGEAVANAFRTGDLSGILNGLGAVAAGIGTVFANLGVLLFETLRPQVERAVRFLAQAFDRIDFGAIAARILEVVRLIGFVLGSIVSDPRFILALEAIAVAAIAVGAKFVQGFAQGVISNLPDLTRLIGGQLRTAIIAAVEFAFNNPAVIGQIILAALAARALLSAYTRAGEAGGGSMVRGFARGIAKSPGQIAQAFSGLFGGTGAINRAIERDAQRTAENYQRQFSRTLRNFQRLGFDTTGLLNTDVDEQALRRLNDSFDTTVGKIGETRAAARLFRERTVEAVGGVRTAVGELGRAMVPGLTGSATRARAGLSQSFTAISDGIAGLRAQGKLSGAGLGNAVLAGFGAALAGQQVGQGNVGIGLAGILASSLAAGLATGIPVIGVAVGAVGLLSAAFSANKAAAEQAAREIGEYTEALKDAKTFSEQVAGAAETVFENILGENRGTQDLLIQLGFDYRQFADDVVSGSFDIQDAVGFIAPAFGDASSQFRREVRTLEGLGLDTADAVQTAATSLGNFLSEGTSVKDVTEAFDALSDESSELRSGLEDIARRRALDGLAGESEAAAQGVERFREQVTGATDDAIVLGQVSPFVLLTEDAQTAADQVGGFLDDIGASASDLLGIDFGAFFDDFGAFDLDAFAASFLAGVEGISSTTRSLLNNTRLFVSGTSDQINQVASDLLNLDRTIESSFDFPEFAPLDFDLFNEQAEEATENANLTREAIRDLNEQRTSAIRSRIESIRGELDLARDAAEQARESLTAFISGRYADTAQAGVDQLIGQVGSIGSEIEEALLQGGVRGEARLRSAVGGFEQQLASIIQAGFEDGLRTQEEFRNLLAPLFAALDEEVGDSASRILSTTDFEFGITDRAGTSLRQSLERALAGRQVEVGVQSIINADAEVRRIEDALNAQEAKLEVDVVFSPEQILAALTAAGATAEQLAGVNPADVVAQQQSGLAGAVASAKASTTATGDTSIEVTTGPTTIEVRGADGPGATALEIARQERANAGRQAVEIGSLIGVRIGSGVAF